MVLEELSSYIEELCREHVEVQHSDVECHYVDLNNDKKQTKLADELRYPGVMFSTGSYRFIGTGTSIQKYHACRLEVWKHVSDTGDYAEVESALLQSEEILNDFIARMSYDKQFRRVGCLTGISFDGCVVQELENKSNALYGCFIEFGVPVSLCCVGRLERFEVKS